MLKVLAKRAIWMAANTPGLSESVFRFFGRRSIAEGWDRKHPFDLLHNTDTSGSLPSMILTPGRGNPYAGAQPSIVKHALEQIPNPQLHTFMDFGCGKGRPLFVAAELGYQKVIGVEYSAPLVEIARQNAINYQPHLPPPPIDLYRTDATEMPLPATPLVIFLYNPFDRTLMSKLLANIEERNENSCDDLFVVYYNPVWADVFDASPSLIRRYAAQIPYAPDEIGYGPDTSDAVIIWQTPSCMYRKPEGNPDAPVRIITPGSRVAIDTV